MKKLLQSLYSIFTRKLTQNTENGLRILDTGSLIHKEDIEKYLSILAQKEKETIMSDGREYISFSNSNQDFLNLYSRIGQEKRFPFEDVYQKNYSDIEKSLLFHLFQTKKGKCFIVNGQVRDKKKNQVKLNFYNILFHGKIPYLVDINNPYKDAWNQDRPSFLIPLGIVESPERKFVLSHKSKSNLDYYF